MSPIKQEPQNKSLNGLKKNKRDEIVAYLESMGIPQEFVSRYLGYKNTSDFFKKGQFPSNKLFKLQFVQRMVLGTGIDPKIFEMPISEEELEKIKEEEKEKGSRTKYYYPGRQTYTQWGPSKALSNTLNLKGFNTPIDANGIDFANLYFKAIEPHLTEFVSSISTVEFLNKGLLEDPWAHLKYYNLAHRKIFRRIEDLYKDKSSFLYERFLAFNSNSDSNKEGLVDTLINMSVATYTHIFAALHKFNANNITIGLVPIERPVNYAIVKYSNKSSIIIVSEYYKFDTDGKTFIPDTLFINECPSYKHPMTDIVELYSDDIISFRGRSRNKKYSITKENIHSLMNSAQQKVKNGKITSVQKYMDKKTKNINILKKKLGLNNISVTTQVAKKSLSLNYLHHVRMHV